MCTGTHHGNSNTHSALAFRVDKPYLSSSSSHVQLIYCGYNATMDMIYCLSKAPWLWKGYIKFSVMNATITLSRVGVDSGLSGGNS